MIKSKPRKSKGLVTKYRWYFICKVSKKFKDYINSLEANLMKLLDCNPVIKANLPNSSGVYLFSERGNHLYVGRSKNIKKRITGHTALRHNSASFAFLLARETSGEGNPTYKTKGSREYLMKDNKFKEHFNKAIERIKNMDIRYVKEDDPIRQTLLEIYAAVELNTPYNRFETH